MNENQLKQLVEEMQAELQGMNVKMEGLIQKIRTVLEETPEQLEVTVGEVRKQAILEEIARRTDPVSPEDISALARKYGKNPSSCSGYYSGANCSLQRDSGGGAFRELTEEGKRKVEQYRGLWGREWLEQVDIEKVGASSTPDDAVLFLVKE